MARFSGNRQSGAALIIVLLILAFMISIAATMTERLSVSFTRAENRLSHQQAYWYSIGVEALAKYGIKESYQDSDIINLGQPWALKDQVYPLEYGQARGNIRDMQACFNINALTKAVPSENSNTKPYLVSVWQLILEELGVENYQAEVIADSTKEFLDPDDRVLSGYGVEDSSYEALQPAYITANGMIADGTELRAVYQMNNEIMQLVTPVVCAIPWDDFRLNINTVSEKERVILVALFSSQLSLDDAASLIKNRPFDGWQSVNDFLVETEIAAIEQTVRDKAKGYLTTDSRYFELDAEVVVNESRVRIRSLLYSKDRTDVAVIRRRFGGVLE